MRSTSSGAFTSRYARRKRWRLHERLAGAIAAEIVSPFVDAGAGVGEYVRYWLCLGKHGYGLDGIEGVKQLSGGWVEEVDLSYPLDFETLPTGNTVISIEVGEHIPEHRACFFLDNLCQLSRQRLIVSWAVPGQRGSGHINCRPPEWVRDQVCERGFRVSSRNELLREAAGRGWRAKLWLFERR